MKKAPITFEGMVQSVSFPNKGIVIPVDREPSDMPVPPTGFSLPEKPSRPVRVDLAFFDLKIDAFQYFQRLAVRDRKSTRLNSSHTDSSRMPSSA